jgi:hypothetical protein
MRRNFGERYFRDCPKRGLSDAPRMDSAAMRKAKWIEKGRSGSPYGSVAYPSEPFQTVYPRRS